MTNKFKISFCFKLLFLVICSPAFAQAPVSQNLKINLSNTRQVNVIEEIIHPAKVSAYEPKLILGQVKKEVTDAASPEAAVLNWLSAMQGGSYAKH